MIVLTTRLATHLVHFWRRIFYARLLTARRSLLERVAALLLRHCHSLADAPTVRLAAPEQLEAAYSRRGCALAFSPGEPPLTDDGLAAACELTLEYSVNSSSPRFFNQLSQRVDPVAVAGEWIAATTNTNAMTYEIAPVVTLMERAVIARFAAAVGPRFAAAHDGLFVPGSSIGNLYALLLARDRAAPSLRQTGAAGGPRLVAFVSSDAHFSFAKGAAVLGLGLDNLVRVATDARGRMDVGALRDAVAAARAAGGVPFFVGATAGSTVLGAFDDLKAIRAVCDAERMWLHADAAWGGAALFSPTHRALLDGVDAADSVACSLHKMLGVALQAAVFVARAAGALDSNKYDASYLYQRDKLHASMDLGDRSIQVAAAASRSRHAPTPHSSPHGRSIHSAGGSPTPSRPGSPSRRWAIPASPPASTAASTSPRTSPNASARRAAPSSSRRRRRAPTSASGSCRRRCARCRRPPSSRGATTRSTWWRRT